MANPPSAIASRLFKRQLDPANRDLRRVTLKQDGSFLFPNEGVASYTLAPSAEAVAAGLKVETDAWAPALNGLVLDFYLSVVPGMQGASAFGGTGMQLGVEATFVTDAVPPRTLQVTFVQEVANQ